MAHSPTISLLVPTYNRASVIARIWRSWLAQPAITQLVLVDDGSTQDYGSLVAEIAAEFHAANKNFVYMRNATRQGSPAAKNRGVIKCTGDYILTTDDDINLGPTMAADLLQTAGEHPGAVIGARVVYLKDGETREQAELRSDQDHSPLYFNQGNLTVTAWLKLAAPIQSPFVTAVALWPARYFAAGLRWFEGYGGNGYREETDPQILVQSRYGATIWYASHATCYHLPPALAYSEASGQRRGGPLWFEYWVLRNNWIFLRRHSTWLRETLGVRMHRALGALLLERFGPRRLGKLAQSVFRRGYAWLKP